MLTVRAYTAEDARNVNALLLRMSERLVNQLNDRSRSDLISVAEKEVKASEDRAKDASLALSSFRSRQSVFDPDRQAAMQLQGTAKLQEELLATETQLAQLRQVSPNNPQIPSLVSRSELLREAIARQEARVAGKQPGSFTTQSSGYDRLVLEKTFAERQLATSLAALENARNEAQRQQLYLETLVQPNLPDKAIEPRRLRTVAMVFLLGLIVWGVLSLVVSSVQGAHGVKTGAVPGRETSFMNSLAIQLRVIRALLMREVITRFGRHNLGVLWLLGEPMLFTLGVAALWSAAGLSHGSGLPIIAFAITGYSSVLMWRNSVSRTNSSIQQNFGLLYHRNVQVIDVFLTRIILEIAGATGSFIVLALFFTIGGWIKPPEDLLDGGPGLAHARLVRYRSRR